VRVAAVTATAALKAQTKRRLYLHLRRVRRRYCRRIRRRRCRHHTLTFGSVAADTRSKDDEAEADADAAATAASSSASFTASVAASSSVRPASTSTSSVVDEIVASERELMIDAALARLER
jgi:hypothetical protein